MLLKNHCHNIQESKESATNIKFGYSKFIRIDEKANLISKFRKKKSFTGVRTHKMITLEQGIFSKMHDPALEWTSFRPQQQLYVFMNFKL